MISWQRLTLLLMGLLGAFAVGVAVFAPQFPRLLKDGFPPPIYKSTLPTVTVSVVPEGTVQKGELPKAAVDRFLASSGRAFMASRDGNLIGAAYGSGVSPDTLLNSYSMVKSLIGVMVLRAVADGQLTLDMTLPEILGDQAPGVTVHALMDMTSGLVMRDEPPKTDIEKTLDDRDFSPFSPIGRLHVFGIQAILPRIETNQDLKGTFHYQSANTALLGLVLETVYDQPLPDLLARMIWSPAKAQPAQWLQNRQTDRVMAYCCLFARASDWLKVGQFLIQNGTSEAPLLPPDVWASWITPAIPAEDRRFGAYRHHMRHDILDRPGEKLQGDFAYFMGHGGQVLYLLPDHDMVVVRFGDGPQLLHSTLYELVP